MDVRSLRHQRSSWTQHRSRQVLQAVIWNTRSAPKKYIFRRTTPVFVHFSLQNTAVLLGRLALFAGRLYRYVLSHFPSGTSSKLCSVCHVRFEQIFQKLPKVHRSLHAITSLPALLMASIAGPRPGTGLIPVLSIQCQLLLNEDESLFAICICISAI